MKYSKPLSAITGKCSAGLINGRTKTAYIQLLNVAVKVAAMEDIAARRFPEDNEAKHQRRVANAATSLKTMVEQMQSSVSKQIAELRNQINREIEVATRLEPRVSGQEVRSVLRGLDESERMQAIKESIEGGDSEVLSAVFHGNDLTSGFKREVRNQLVGVYQRKMAPELFDELETVSELEESSGVFFGVAEKAANSAFDPKYIEKIAEEERRAVEAQRKFEEASE